MKKNSSKKTLTLLVTVVACLTIASCAKTIPTSMPGSESLSELTDSSIMTSDSSSMESIDNSDGFSSIIDSANESTIKNSSIGSSIKNSSTTTTPGVTPSAINKSVVPKAPYQAKKLYVCTIGGSMPIAALTYADEAMATSLQGLVATKGTDQIFFNPMATFYSTLLPVLKSKFGVTTQDVSSLWELPNVFKSKIAGYILYSIDMQDRTVSGSVQKKNIDPSVNVATTLANQFNAIIVSKENEQKAIALGFTKLLDVSGWKDEDFLNGGKASQYFSKLDKSTLTENSTYYSAECRDYTVMSNTFLFNSLSPSRNEIFDLYSYNTPLLGWGGENEGANVMRATAKGLYTVATSPGHNFSTLSGFKVDSVTQKRGAAITKQAGTHTVCFMLTDGDNVPFNVSNFYNRQWYGNKNVGQIKMGFGLSTVLIDISGPALLNYYDQMSTKTNFIAHLSGLGYMYPSRLPEGVLADHVKQVNSYMKRSDMKILQVMDYSKIDDMTLWSPYLAQPSIEALFYIDYTNYALANGKVNWSNGKPIIGTRYAMWTGLPNGDSPTIISKINNASTDITSTDSYSLISVHAWTKTISDVASMISSFDSDVRVVTPEEFVTLMKENVKR